MEITKYEWRKQEKEYYLPKEDPSLVTVPSYKFITLEGEGNPNSEDFSDAIGVLYSVAYGIKMLPKSGIVPEGYFDYTVYPLEGVWTLLQDKGDKFDKNKLYYKLMIRQPDFVTNELFEYIIERTSQRKPHDRLAKVEFSTITDGLCLQILHLGSYDDESRSFEKMNQYCIKNNLIKSAEWHKEIYLNDARKTKVDKLKTVLRYSVEKKSI